MFDWSTPFDISMLDSGDGLIIRVPTLEFAEELAVILDGHGTVWGGGERIPGNTSWDSYGDNTAWVYYPRGRSGDFDNVIRRGAAETLDEYERLKQFRRCTFTGLVLDDIDIPDGIELF